MSKPIHRSELSNRRMVAGNEKKYDIIIIGGVVKKWVGIGWIDLNDATEEDYNKYPQVVD